MKKNMILLSLVVLGCLAIPASAVPIALPTNVACSSGPSVVCGVGDKMTYLLAVGPGLIPDGITPLVIDLQTVGGLGLSTGSVINLFAEGDMCFSNGTSCMSPSFGGVFSSSALFESNHFTLNRVINALSAPSGTTDAATGTTSVGSFNTNISQDFMIFQGSGTQITLPNISTYRYLFVGILDSLYSDNTDGGTLPVDLQLRLTAASSAIPEPGTYGLMLSGLGALLAFRRYRKN